MGMTKQELINKMTVVTEPNRHLDQAIAVFFNYRRKKSTIPLSGLKTQKIRVTWHDPRGNELREVPHFTRDIDAAKSLMDFVLPNTPGGFSFHDGYAKATIAGGETVSAFNIATALCLATITAAPTANNL